MVGNNSDIEKHLRDAADELRANSRLKSSEYSVRFSYLLNRIDSSKGENDPYEGMSSRHV